VEVRFQGTFDISTHVDQNGNLTMEIVRLHHASFTYTNPASGASLWIVDTGINKYTFEEDGSVTVAFIGNVASVTAPGQGVVAQEVGRLVFDAATGAVSFAAGQHDLRLTGHVAALCAALA
jgi:hypothetical protein